MTEDDLCMKALCLIDQGAKVTFVVEGAEAIISVEASAVLVDLLRTIFQGCLDAADGASEQMTRELRRWRGSGDD